MRDSKHPRDEAFELRRRANHARTEAGAARPTEVEPELEAEACALEDEAHHVRPRAPG
jgi:hypothetical protein